MNVVAAKEGISFTVREGSAGVTYNTDSVYIYLILMSLWVGCEDLLHKQHINLASFF
jgi:hypothetical protein